MALKLKRKPKTSEEEIVKITIRVPKKIKQQLDILIDITTIESINSLILKAVEELIKRNKELLEDENKELLEDYNEELTEDEENENILARKKI